ncbi:DUF3127 domain-containing protein [Siphonobacter aquaeclarae]|jgi:hypothetical protein|uniref:DUF3127 domain-containing protein n=1 Tax=Siphonobacter aquaeclarae TaxID=563176 RepID=A0A1G9RU55_9BACT|nr:DUF3127 domain-containing protein [Siphonobacter aquaeclarae]MBO9638411.1 DUF3127 domain-containing protein [Siphonobacter aquaeclarae]SDM26694.1 protein of unknown function [Siphonobacter aquaeclarae]
MALEIEGVLHVVLPEVGGTSKTGNSWAKQDFVIETEDQYPKKVNFSLWGDKLADLKQFAPGDKIKVSFNLESREYNGRWYTEARAWKVELVDKNGFLGNSGGGDPFGDIPPSSLMPSDGGTDDLPF